MDHPEHLKFTHWDKRKGSLAAGSELAGLLKALQKRHDGVAWKLFDPGWAKAAKNAAELQEAFAQRDRLARSSLFALKKDANEIAGVAAKGAKDKSATKPALEAGKAIAAAAKAYADDLDALIDGLKTTHDKALATMPPEDADDEPPSVLLDQKQLLKWLSACRRDPERRVQFAYVDGKDKQAAVLAMSPRMTARKVFAALQRETGVKTGAYGTAWVDDKSLMLKVDKPLGGLAKKVRPPLRAAGFRIARVVLWREDGTLFEQDEDADEADAAVAEIATATDTAVGPGMPSAPAAAAPAEPAIAPAPGRFVHQAKVRLAWQMARQKLAADLQSLQAAILEHYRQQPELADLAGRVRRFDDVLVTLDESLTDKLDEALNAADASQRSALHEQARAILGTYAKYVRDEPLVAALDDNPFVALSTHKTLLKTLQVLGNSLA